MDRFNWRFPVYAALLATVVFPLAAIWTFDTVLYVLFIGPLISLFLLAFSIYAGLKKRPRRALAIFCMLLVYWVVTASLMKNNFEIRNRTRWLVGSDRYKAEVLAEVEPANGQLKHIDWDGWGFPGAGDTTVYLVFDPTDSLAPAAKASQGGKFVGIPCNIPRVSRLESGWYAVLFYTDERWGTPGKDCGVQD